MGMEEPLPNLTNVVCRSMEIMLDDFSFGLVETSRGRFYLWRGPGAGQAR